MEDRIIKTEYSDEMQKSFVDYAMSVIVARALPDVRDGLKPVQRRVLYDMSELGIKFDKPYRKSARIVGDTMGKYHPHGDSSIYEALVVMAQDFKKGLPLVDGHGNFGNIEGDGAAAMRYTEARLQKITQEAFLADLDKDIVDFVPNFDETEKEPSVLPVKIPNILVNGSEGIAVGMATNIPPHNLGEVIEATKAYMRDENISTKDLMKYIKGPDFPTGGIVTNKDELLDIYESGVGKIKIRGKVEIEKAKGGHINVVITEIPYTMIGANIGKFLQDIAQLSETKKTQDIVDISNQSSKEGIRIVIELRKDADAENFVNLLYKKTHLEDTFGVNMLAINNGTPEIMGLKQVIKACVDFQYEVNTRKYNNLLEKEKERKEIQEGLIKAVNVIDLIIEILRGSKDRQMAKDCLTTGKTDGINFKSKESKIMAEQLQFTEKQANAILEMRLYKLIGLELDALVKEHDETLANIYRYEDILDRKDSMASVIIKELDEIKKEFSKPRKTVIENCEEAVYKEKEFEVMDVYYLMDRFGYAKLIDKNTYERNVEACESEFRYCFMIKNNGRIAMFTEDGQMHVIKAMDLPMSKLRDKGTPVDNVTNYKSEDGAIVYVCDMDAMVQGRLLFATKGGLVKIVQGLEFETTRKTIASTKLTDKDEVAAIVPVTDEKNIVMKSRNGYFLRFQLEEISLLKKVSQGVRGMKLDAKDQVEEVYLTKAVDDKSIEHNGHGLVLNTVKLQKRDAKGTRIK